MLQPLDVGLVVMEATGGYEAALACALQATGLSAAVVNPRQARDFAKSMGRLGEIAALVGVAPMASDSGNSKGRRVLYMVMSTAARHNPAIKAFYERLKATDKLPKVARWLACASC